MVAFPPPQNVYGYLATAFLACLSIRLFLTLILWSEGFSKPAPQPTFWSIFLGFKVGEGSNDYFQPFIIGFLELLVYPVLLAADKPEYVGAWLGLKVLPQLGSWSTHRETYQRFLIGNALVIVSSYFIRRCFYA